MGFSCSFSQQNQSIEPSMFRYEAVCLDSVQQWGFRHVLWEMQKWGVETIPRTLVIGLVGGKIYDRYLLQKPKNRASETKKYNSAYKMYDSETTFTS